MATSDEETDLLPTQTVFLKSAGPLRSRNICGTGVVFLFATAVVIFALGVDIDPPFAEDVRPTTTDELDAPIFGTGELVNVAVHKYTPPKTKEDQDGSTCRIQNACLSMSLDNYEVVIPTSMSSMPDNMLLGCQKSGIKFRSADPPGDAIHHKEDLLLGFFPGKRSYSLAHFILGAGVLIDMAETLLGDRTVSQEEFVVEKYGQLQDGRWAVSEVGEPSVWARRNSVQPAILVDPLVRDEGLEKAKWIGSFAANILRGSPAEPLFLSPPRDNTTFETHCFRSVWTPPRSLDSKRDARLARSSIFQDMGVEKSPRDAVCQKKGVLKVSILNRLTTRSIMNLDEVRKAAYDALAPHFKNIDMKEIAFDEATYDDQVAAMQDTDVLIAAHGAAIANAVFLRERSFLLEISPFCYNFPGFQRGQNSTFDIESSFVVSGPDLDGFKSGLMKFCRIDNSCERLLQAYQDLVGIADMEKVQRNLRKFNEYEECAVLENNIFSNRGLKAQRLRPDTVLVSSRLRDWAEKRC